MKKVTLVRLPLLLLSLLLVGMPVSAGTIVPGQDGRYDTDNNGYPDAGKIVTGVYTSVYAYDDADYYWDLGDGRVEGTVASIDDLNASTRTICNYQVQYRGGFGNDPFLNSGWIKNNINCSGYDDNGQYNYVIVHQTDPRFRNNPDWSIWGEWEYHTLTESKNGNLVRPLGNSH